MFDILALSTNPHGPFGSGLGVGEGVGLAVGPGVGIGCEIVKGQPLGEPINFNSIFCALVRVCAGIS